MLHITSRLPQVGTTIFTIMSALAQQHGAINLSQGFPDFPCDPDLTALVSKYMQAGYNQYAPMAGIMPLRERISEKTELLYQCYFDPELEVTVTSGATEALFAAIAAVVHPGDEVIVLEPCYDSYIPAIQLNGAKAVPVPLSLPDYSPDWIAIANAISERTKAIVINSPHNPSGNTWSDCDLERLAGLLDGTNIVVVSDEVYEHICFEGQHQSVLLNRTLRERSFVISSFGKTFHTTGWKIGYALAPAFLMREFRKIHQFLTFSTCTPMQYALADYLAEEGHYLGLADFYRQKRDLFVQILSGSRFKIQPSPGTYFQLADYSGISEMNDMDFAQYLTMEHGVAAIPVSVFCSEPPAAKTIRFCFAKADDTLYRAAEKLVKL
jgi:methionine aminotransferase